MANVLTKLITHYGEEVDPEWHVSADFDTSRTLCGYALDGAVAYEAETKIVKKGGITCEKCLSLVKQIKAIKL